MKPGLRKVAALILATATLFGSGASAVSAAYADDTTMGTSTRIQTEPDVKTTTGGDEAATKPDTGSGDEAGTGADEQSGTGAPAQSAPQADAGQAAPDVTVHDMLDTDSAAVSRPCSSTASPAPRRSTRTTRAATTRTKPTTSSAPTIR